MMRAIDPSKFVKEQVPASFGPAAQLQWLPIASLVVDETYQRPLAQQGERTVRSIIAKFDWRMFAPVVVSPIPGGLYAIVDGQHRTTAAAACGHEQVPCAVIMADRQQQAVAFGAINGVVTKVSRHQQHKAAIAAGDPMALRILEVTKAAGVRVLFANKQASDMKPGETLALTVIKKAIEVHGDAVAARALKAIVASAGELGGYLRAPIIAAVVAVLADHLDWTDDRRLASAFEQIDLEESWRKSNGAAAARRGVVAGDVLQAEIISHLFRTYGARAAA